ncbi:hypothetical protein [Methanosphaera cuniculi]|uniref:Uncharacterized protein n=1 Tax=Methanosphaera cuniculi TaxID=1077256 RepID=A0A2A2HE37_9EURY|nr:hypothetical protein [Methanosphaera cuniculi]PAV07657.1 hypothetical protein ASJ82_08245 [Methanosphaera cuniculi]PWL08017.1 hypothetical protein MSCUN_09480 [Methanosphaera cuniculi]
MLNKKQILENPNQNQIEEILAVIEKNIETIQNQIIKLELSNKEHTNQYIMLQEQELLNKLELNKVWTIYGIIESDFKGNEKSINQIYSDVQELIYKYLV